jgi:hypothetical protein
MTDRRQIILSRKFLLFVFSIFVFSNLFCLYAQQTAINKIQIALEGKGINGVTVGQTTATEITKKFGKDHQLITYPNYSNQIKYEKLGLSFYYCLADKKQKIFSIELRNPYEVKTSKGIILGKSKVRDVFRIYGVAKGVTHSWLSYQGIDFRNINLETNEINSLSKETTINEINIYPFNFVPCQKIVDEPKTEQ